MFRIHAQRTDRNDRLCSLLSATLLRSARPQFSRAVLEKSSRRPRRRSRDFKGGSYPAIMFVHQQESSSKNPNVGLGFRNILEQIADDYGAFIIDVTLTNYPLNDISYAFQKLEARQVVLISCGGISRFLHQFLAQLTSQDDDKQLDRLLGLISVFPGHHPLVYFCQVPLLIITSSDECGEYHRQFMANSDVIVVLGDGIRIEDLDEESGAVALWVARTISKFTQVLHFISEHHFDESSNLCTLPINEGIPIHSNLISRL